ncbi:MAG TPA: DegQ family serine endoprotease [Methylomirabilota bacterium]|nr:DegQ family serine endoprotease [Methylomirabilota bacterium]
MKNLSQSVMGIVAGMLFGVAILVSFHFNLFGKDVAPSISVDSTPIVRDVKTGTSYAPIVKKAAPSVVNIYSTHTVHVRPMQDPFMNNPLFRQFFGDQLPQNNRDLTRKEQSLGSGVIVSADGYILTANHVVYGADEIKVALGDNADKKFTAKVIGTDPQTDVAILKIDATGLPAVTLGDSDQLEIGDVVLAVGNPFGVGQTVTKGIISALGRHGYGINGIHGFENFIQTDAAINPGNSGGALVDADGRLIGINTWIATSSGGSEGVGFAVPINMARRVMNSLITHGKVARGYLGIHPQDLTADLAKAFGLANQGGALVGGIFPNTPAAKAGVKSGDIITEFNGKPVTDAHTLTLMVSDCAPGSDATVKVIRKGAAKTFTVTLGELPGENGKNEGAQTSNSSTTDALDGVTVTDLDSQMRDELQIPADIKGVIVTDVGEDSNAADAGLQKGDVIVEINQRPAANSDEAKKLCNQAKTDRLLLEIWRREGDMATTTYLSVDNTKRDKEK